LHLPFWIWAAGIVLEASIGASRGILRSPGRERICRWSAWRPVQRRRRGHWFIIFIFAAIVIVVILITVVPELLRDARNGKAGPLATYVFWVVGIPSAIFYGGFFNLSFWQAVGAGFGSSLVLGMLTATCIARR